MTEYEEDKGKVCVQRTMSDETAPAVLLEFHKADLAAMRPTTRLNLLRLESMSMYPHASSKAIILRE